jgi:hypothetical protein
MIEYTEKVPSVMYALKRDRVRRGEGLRKIENAGEWMVSSVSGKAWAVLVGLTYFAFDELYLDEAEATQALVTLVKEEYRREREAYQKKVKRLQANIPHTLIGSLI